MKRIVSLLFLVFFVLGIAINDSCKKESVIPTLTTSAVTNITINSATTGGVITKDGGAEVTARGVCWATTANPLVSGSHTSDENGIGSFVSNLTDLTPNTLYHVRAYATNSVGTAYGADVSFTTTAIVAPTVTTTDVTLITLTSAVSGGNVTADGGGTVSARGVCWSTDANPSITDSKTSDGTGTGSFISTLSNLLPGTAYHIRAYATNETGTSYGNDVTFTTTAVGVATLTTTAVTAITLTSAVSGGNVTADNGAAVTAKGVCWATTSGPTVTNSKTTDGTGTGSFVSNLSGLLPATTYYVRAYATNSAGTAYGNEVSFTTSQIVIPTLTTADISSITTTTAVSGGTILNNGGGTITTSGVCWSTAANPTISNSITTDGTLTGSYVSNITGLLPGTTYHVRAYAVNSTGTGYGNDVQFTTLVTVPTLTTSIVTSITQTTAVSGGNITSDGGGAVTAYGTCWATTANPTTAGSHTTDGTGTGIFSSNLTGLVPGNTYHVRAYATNSAGTAYGNDLSFTTAVALPTLTTAAITSITQTTATSGGTITDNGGGTITTSGICWAITANPTTANSKTTDGTPTGSFTSNMTGLTSGTTYHVRAYATNGAGTAYGNDVQFTTNPAALPTLTTVAISSIGATSAVSGGNISSDGNGNITAKGVCWGTTSGPDITGSKTIDGTGSGSYTSTMTGLTAGTIYYVRAYATNSAGTSYGNELSFTTIVADADGNTYTTVTIGTQVWLGQNLKTTKFSNGDPIPTTPSLTTDISGETSPIFQWPDNDPSMNDVSSTYGRLYTWYAAADSRNVCPAGWRVPSVNDLESLKTFLGGAAVAGGKLKEVGTAHWTTPNTGATDDYGFTALPAGQSTNRGICKHFHLWFLLEYHCR